jgi:alkylation response protein AidB-like acyl-CoA dehydrogenase
MEMLGVGCYSFEMTLDYLKTRKQFGKVIGSFQALGHRAAELYSAQEMARSCAEAGVIAIDQGADDEAAMSALSKAKTGEFLFDMSNQLIQIHGGIGMTDEFDAGLYLKRARVLETTYGNQATIETATRGCWVFESSMSQKSRVIPAFFMAAI